MDKEKLIKEIMAECAKDGEPVTREEAEEIAEMEIKQKAYCKRYERESRQNKPAIRAPKIDTEKVEIINIIAIALVKANYGKVTTANKQKEITFTVNGNEYSLTLTKHRKKK